MTRRAKQVLLPLVVAAVGVLVALFVTGLWAVAVLGLPLGDQAKWEAIEAMDGGTQLQADALILSVRHGGADWRYWSITALGMMESRESVRALVGLLADERRDVCVFAAFQLAADGDDAGLGILNREIAEKGQLAERAKEGVYLLRLSQDHEP